MESDTTWVIARKGSLRVLFFGNVKLNNGDRIR